MIKLVHSLCLKREQMKDFLPGQVSLVEDQKRFHFQQQVVPVHLDLNVYTTLKPITRYHIYVFVCPLNSVSDSVYNF